MSLTDWTLLGGVLLAVLGAGSIVFDAYQGGDQPRFVAYLVGLLLTLAGIGVVLSLSI